MTHPKDHEALTRLRANLASSNIDAHSGLLIRIRPDDIRTVLDLITRLEAEGEWQPIETAPKPKWGEPRQPILLTWTYADRPAQSGEGWWYEDEEGDGDWWWANTGPGDYFSDTILNSITGQITHWRPLPAPPALQSSQPKDPS